MGDILDELRSPSFPIGQRFALCQEAADEIERLRAAYADMVDRADRAEDDADRLAANLSRMPCACERGNIYYRCSKCVVLDLHDKEVEAR